MNIIFTRIPSNAVTGRIDIENGQVKDVSGSANVYLNNWQLSGRSLAEFEDYYSSWSNGYAKSESEAGTLEPTIAFTVDDDGNVAELIKSDETGIFIRENGDWSPVDTDKPQPTIDDLEWLDVNDDALKFWDDEGENSDAVTREDVLKYAIDSE